MANTHRLLFRILALFAIVVTRIATADDAIRWIQAGPDDPYVWYHVKWADHDANHYVYVQIAMTTHPGNPVDVGVFSTNDYVIYCARGGFVPVHLEAGGGHVVESEFMTYAEQPSGLIGGIAAVVCQQ